jgi:hypothetical protein
MLFGFQQPGRKALIIIEHLSFRPKQKPRYAEGKKGRIQNSRKLSSAFGAFSCSEALWSFDIDSTRAASDSCGFGLVRLRTRAASDS